jgi:hypothetical protein
MFYITYLSCTIDILKCAKCKSYDLSLSPSESHDNRNKWSAYAYRCWTCDEFGTLRLSNEVHLEEFASWEALQNRIDELKATMSLMELE